MNEHRMRHPQGYLGIPWILLTLVSLCLKSVLVVHGACVLKGCREGIQVMSPWHECQNDTHLLCDDPADSNFNLTSSFDRRGPVSGFEVDCYGHQEGLDRVQIQDDLKLDHTWMRTVHLHNCGLQSVFVELYYEGFFELGLHNNDLNSLSNLTIEDTAAILSVDISYNLLSTISELTDSYTHLWVTRVKYWNFEGNQIVKLEPRVFQHLPIFADYINLNNNKIKWLPLIGLENMTSGMTLLLKNNQISGIQDEAFTWARIKTLDLSDNVIKSISSDTFSNVLYIEDLILSRNHITSIASSAFDIPGLTTLRLSNNKLFQVPDNVFNGQPHLVTLDLSHNSITSIEYGAFGSLHLRLLDLSHNPLLQLSEKVFPLARISNLKLADCLLGDFPEDVVARLHKSLRYLDLSRNLIRSLPESWNSSQPNSGVSIMDLSHNRVDKLNCSVLRSPFPLLARLYLHDNGIRGIDRCIGFAKLKLTLRDNHLDCCSLGWLKRLNTMVTVIADADQVMCRWPKHARFLDGDMDFSHLCTEKYDIPTLGPNLDEDIVKPKVPTAQIGISDILNKFKNISDKAEQVENMLFLARQNVFVANNRRRDKLDSNANMIVNERPMMMNMKEFEIDTRQRAPIKQVDAKWLDVQRPLVSVSDSPDDVTQSWKGPVLAVVIIIGILLLVVGMVMLSLLAM